MGIRRDFLNVIAQYLSILEGIKLRIDKDLVIAKVEGNNDVAEEEEEA